MTSHEAELEQLQSEIEAIAASFHWDPAGAWIQEIKASLTQDPFYKHLLTLSHGIHVARYHLYKLFDHRTYYRGDREVFEITACYTDARTPDPLAVATRGLYDPRNAGFDRVVVGSHDTTIYDGKWPLMKFVGYGRKIDGGHYRRSINAARLLASLGVEPADTTGLALPDMAHFYEERVYTRSPEGTWEISAGQTVRA